MKKRIGDRSIREIIAGRQQSIMLRRDYRCLVWRVIFAFLAGWLLVTQVFAFYRYSGNGMFPAVMDGDLLIGYRLKDRYSRKDTVLYTINGTRQAGRIAACPGDLVDFSDSGVLTINGTAESGRTPDPSLGTDSSYPMEIPEDCVFILGDCPAGSKDSREFGPVPADQIQAGVITLLRRRNI